MWPFLPTSLCSLPTHESGEQPGGRTGTSRWWFGSLDQADLLCSHIVSSFARSFLAFVHCFQLLQVRKRG